MHSRLNRDDEGSTMVEYGLLIALIALALIAAVGFFASGTLALYDEAGTVTSSIAARP